MREAVVIACVLLASPAGAQDNIFEVLKNAPGGFYVLKDVPTEFRGRWCLYGKSVAKEMSELFGRPLLDVTYKPCTPGARPHLVIAHDTLDIGPGPFYACHVDRVGLRPTSTCRPPGTTIPIAARCSTSMTFPSLWPKMVSGDIRRTTTTCGATRFRPSAEAASA